MKVIYEGKTQEIELKGKLTVEFVAKKMKIPLETVIAKKNGKILTDISELSNDDEVEFLRVISGG